MRYDLFASRVLELFEKQEQTLSIVDAAELTGCPVDLSTEYLERMVAGGALVMKLDDGSKAWFRVPGSAAPTKAELSWEPEKRAQRKVMAIAPRRNPVVAAGVGLLFGPVGMLYTTGLGAIVTWCLAVGVKILERRTGVEGLWFSVNVLCMAWSALAAVE
jgi:hypothetical protein